MRTLLIDGDVFAFQAAAACERVIHWNEDISTLEGHLSEAQAKVDSYLTDIQADLKADKLIVALSDIGSGYWRRQVLPTYKYNRTQKRKPLVLLPLRAYMTQNYDCRLKPMLEGDDVMGILATHPTLIKGEKVIVSIDKDMKTIPGLFCRNNAGNREIVSISEEEADYFHLYQTLIGDTTDGYSGCPGVGPVAAKKILDEAKPEDRWQAVVSTYKKKGLNEAAALIQARVARILRSTEYDYKEKKPILWNPATVTVCSTNLTAPSPKERKPTPPRPPKSKT